MSRQTFPTVGLGRYICLTATDLHITLTVNIYEITRISILSFKYCRKPR